MGLEIKFRYNFKNNKIEKLYWYMKKKSAGFAPTLTDCKNFAKVNASPTVFGGVMKKFISQHG